MNFTVEEQLKIIMKRHGETVETLCEKMGVTRAAYFQYFRRGKLKKIETIEKIARTLGCKVEINIIDLYPDK